MAITIPTGCYRQPSETAGKDSNGNNTFSYVLKGPYSELETLLNGLEKGDEVISGWLMSSANLARNPGNTGTLTIICAADDAEEGGSSSSGCSTKALKEVWSLKSVRNDVSIFAYCGPSPGGNPQRAIIEAWQKEPDGELANNYSYTKPDGSIFEIDNDIYPATRALIEKIKKGTDAVMRFYPMLTRTRTYSKPPATVYENLAMIDVPTIGSTADFEEEDETTGNVSTRQADTAKLEKPGNLEQIIADHVWLKCQDDCAKTADGKHTRTESWMGILSTDGGWDENLYGKENRWPMPYLHGANN